MLLTPAQRQAVEHLDGPLLILAGPGSGKTRVVTHRIAWLMQQGVRAGSILALTFTNKAADEMRTRVDALAPGERVWIGTFHRFCSRLLREFSATVGLEANFAIYDTSDSRSVLKQAILGTPLADGRFTADQIAHGISQAKNALLPAENFQPRPGRAIDAAVAVAYPRYQQRLLRANAVDFDDLLLHVATLLRENPEIRSRLDSRYRYILVDEYQDTNLAQYVIVRALSNDYPNLAVTGDPDQSIYGWRGANLSNILDFERDYPQVQVVRLEQNYRSTQHIVACADQLIAHNRRRKAKRLFTENPPGQPVRLTRHFRQTDEADAITHYILEEVRQGRRRLRDFAVLYRTNALSRTLEQSLYRQGIPYQLVNSLEFYQRREIKDIVAYLALLNNPRDDQALRRIINVPKRSIGAATIDRLQLFADDSGLTLLDAARQSALVEGVSGRASVAVAKFVALFDRLCLLVGKPVEQVVQGVLQETGYLDPLRESELPEDQDRLANLEELRTAAREFDENHAGLNGLEEFLEQVALVSDTDDWETASDRVTLMTMHAAKGLEFPVVFVVALEQGILPHERSRERDEDLEEERRLLFVAITRAEQELWLSHVRYRAFRGRESLAIPSPFLLELCTPDVEQQDLTGLGDSLTGEIVEHADDLAEWRPADEMPLPAGRRSSAIDEKEHSLGEAAEPKESEQGDDLSFDPQTFESPRGQRDAPRTPAAPTLPKLPRLITGSQLASGTAASEGADFRPGMLVVHAEHGLGRIMAIRGGGARRVATVTFMTDASLRSFVLSSGHLQPVPKG